MSKKNYLDFENRFRGDRESIIDQFSKYDSLVDLVLKDIDSPTLLDVGCGRGEWLQKWSNIYRDCVGIELDEEMIHSCRDLGLNIIDGDAIDALEKIEQNSIHLITVFHLIEHLDEVKLNQLSRECLRILSPEGLLIIETPSIDNILVSSNNFYLDPTHITPINNQRILFDFEKIGFHSSKCYYINGGPLQNNSHLKITRILNGVAQDLLIIATKTSHMTNKIRTHKDKYEKNLNLGIKTLNAAIEYDLAFEAELKLIKSYKAIIKQQSLQIDHHNKQIKLLYAELRFLIRIFKVIKVFLRPVLTIYRLIKKNVLYLCNKVFIFLARHKLIRMYLTTPLFLKLINFCLRFLSNNTTIVTAKQIHKKFDKTTSLDIESIKFNGSLIDHYNDSTNSKYYEKRLLEKKN